MIVKQVSESIKMKKLKVILRRLSPHFPMRKEIEDEVARSNAGYRGEKSLDYHLEILPNENCYILHDLRLPHGTQFFQIDVLIITPHFLLIIEVKNMAGTLHFDQEFNQLIRINNEMEETYPSPISQIYRQKFLFSEWLKKHLSHTIPIESLVVISNPHTRILATPETHDLSQRVIHSNHLLANFHMFNKIHKKEILTKREIKKLSRLLLKEHTYTNPDILQQYNILEKDILKGVFCPKCDTLPMIRNKKKWYCSNCRFYSKDAHVQALRDFAILFGPIISNSQCCNFLQISSSNVAQYILTSLQFPTSGTNRGRKYQISFEGEV
jgi:ribosomal protein S27AE